VSQPAVVKHLLAEFASRRPIRTTSLIITLFGDVVSQHGGTIWLGSLVEALAPFGISDRLVRTSVFRLVREGWLEAERVGRRSYYRFTPYGTHEYERAARRIYALKQKHWNGHWQLLIPLDIPDKSREPFRRSLHWQGFRAIAPGTFAKPGEGGSALLQILQEFDAVDRVLLMEADSSDLSSEQVLRRLVQECWQLDEVAHGYRHFLAHFKPLHQWLLRHPEPEPQAAFIARTLLVHDYRRILLQDTHLPEALLPPGWPGERVLQLTGAAYRALAEPSVAYITRELESGNGRMPPPVDAFWSRFQSLAPD
jgi:phenylacetic acid degradation operon negative regulatory protein